MVETRTVETIPGMAFDVSAEGSKDDPLVLMLHGFGVSRFFWNAQVHAVAERGYFGVAPNQRAGGIENVQSHWSSRGCCQVVVDDGAVRRIFSPRDFGRQRRIRIAIPTKTNGFLRREEMHTFFRDVGVHLPQRRDVIENPERAAVRGND